MNKKGYTEKDFLKYLTIIVAIILLYIVYKAIRAEFGG